MGHHAQGIHPWDLVPELSLDDLKAQFEVIKAKSMLAVGECGLDRRRKNIRSMEEQLVVFRWHIDLAQRLKIPLIVHCVHAESELLSILKISQFKETLLLHDFVGNSKSLEQFKNYNVYYSFGARLFLENKRVLEFFKQVPINKLFLETDDQTRYGIEEIYLKACNLLGINETRLKTSLEENLKSFFQYPDDISAADVIKNFTTSSRI